MALCAFVAALPIGAWADDDVIVTTQTLWQFDNTNITVSEIGNTVTNVLDGLYVRGNDNNKTTIVATNDESIKLGESVSYTFHGVERSTTKILNVQNARPAASYATAQGINTFMQAIHTGVAGTMYAAIAANAPTTGDNLVVRHVYIAFGTNTEGSIEEGTGRSNFIVLSKTATTGGIFEFGADGGAHRIAAIEFIPEAITTPTISQTSGTNTITITPGTSSISGTTLNTYYTTDGSTPTASSTPYTGAFEITGDCTVKAITISSGGSSSTVASKNCTYVTYVLTLSSVTNGTISAKVDGENVISGASVGLGKTVELIATPTNGYNFNGWKDGSSNNLGALPQSIVNTFTMTAATTVNAEFTVQSDLSAITTETTWIFDSFANGQALSGNAYHQYNQLYISGYNDNNTASETSSFAVVYAGEGTTSTGDIAGDVTNYLVLPRTQNTALYHNRSAKGKTPNTISFRAGVAGTVYVYANVANGNINIYEAIGTTPIAASRPANKYTVAATGSNQSISHEVAAGANIFIASSSANFAKIYAIKFVPSSAENVSVTIGSHGLSSFSSTSGLNFSNATPSGLKAYRGKEVNNGGEVVLSSVDEAPAGTGLILKGNAGTTYTIPIKNSATNVGDNLLVATLSQTDVPATTTLKISNTDTNFKNYMWAYTTAKGLGFYHVGTSDATSAAGKAYLSTSTALTDQSNLSSRSFIFDDEETTGINTVYDSEKTQDSFNAYNLSGQRVDNSYKGVIIKNGKKYIVK